MQKNEPIKVPSHNDQNQLYFRPIRKILEVSERYLRNRGFTKERWRRFVKGQFTCVLTYCPTTPEDLANALYLVFPAECPRRYHFGERKLLTLLRDVFWPGDTFTFNQVKKLVESSNFTEADGYENDGEDFAEIIVRHAEEDITIAEIASHLEELNMSDQETIRGQCLSRKRSRSHVDILSDLLLPSSNEGRKWLIRALLRKSPLWYKESFKTEFLELMSPSWKYIIQTRANISAAAETLSQLASQNIEINYSKRENRLMRYTIFDSEAISPVDKEFCQTYLSPQHGVYIQHVSALPISKPAEAMKQFRNMGSEVLCEVKYDGERMQIHVDFARDDNEQVIIYSKSKRNSTSERSRAIPIIKSALGHHTTNWEFFGLSGPPASHRRVTSCIIEGELLTYDETTNRIEPWGNTRAMAKGGYQDSESVHYFIAFFDVLMVDGESLIHVPLKTRRTILESIIVSLPHYAILTECRTLHVSQIQELTDYFAQALKFGEEGLVLKSANSAYRCSSKGIWKKMKRNFVAGLGDTIDFVVVGGSTDLQLARKHGLGSRVLTHFYLGLPLNKQEYLESNGQVQLCLAITMLTSDWSFGSKELESFTEQLSNQKVPTNDPSDPECPYLPNSTNLVSNIVEWRDLGKNHWWTFDDRWTSSEVKARRPTVFFRTPFVAEIKSDQPLDSSSGRGCSLRFPTIEKIKYHRSWEDAVDYVQFQEIARSVRQSQRTAPDDKEGLEKIVHAINSERVGPKIQRGLTDCLGIQTGLNDSQPNVGSNEEFKAPSGRSCVQERALPLDVWGHGTIRQAHVASICEMTSDLNDGKFNHAANSDMDIDEQGRPPSPPEQEQTATEGRPDTVEIQSEFKGTLFGTLTIPRKRISQTDTSPTDYVPPTAKRRSCFGSLGNNGFLSAISARLDNTRSSSPKVGGFVDSVEARLRKQAAPAGSHNPLDNVTNAVESRQSVDSDNSPVSKLRKRRTVDSFVFSSRNSQAVAPDAGHPHGPPTASTSSLKDKEHEGPSERKRRSAPLPRTKDRIALIDVETKTPMHFLNSLFFISTKKDETYDYIEKALQWLGVDAKRIFGIRLKELQTHDSHLAWQDLEHVLRLAGWYDKTDKNHLAENVNHETIRLERNDSGILETEDLADVVETSAIWGLPVMVIVDDKELDHYKETFKRCRALIDKSGKLSQVNDVSLNSNTNRRPERIVVYDRKLVKSLSARCSEGGDMNTMNPKLWNMWLKLYCHHIWRVDDVIY